MYECILYAPLTLCLSSSISSFLILSANVFFRIEPTDNMKWCYFNDFWWKSLICVVKFNGNGYQVAILMTFLFRCWCWCQWKCIWIVYCGCIWCIMHWVYSVSVFLNMKSFRYFLVWIRSLFFMQCIWIAMKKLNWEEAKLNHVQIDTHIHVHIDDRLW